MICSSSSGRSFFLCSIIIVVARCFSGSCSLTSLWCPRNLPASRQQSTNTAKRNPYKRDDLSLWSVFVLKFESAPIHRGGETCFELGYGAQVEL